jgi:hypothetical protein
MTLPDPDFLVESIPNPLHGSRPVRRWVWLAIVTPLLISAGAAYICYAAAGTSLGLFLGGLVWAGVLSGPFIAAEETWLGRGLAALGIIGGIGAVWLIAAMKGNLPIGLWAAACAAMAAMVIAIGGLVTLLRRLRCDATVAGAIVTVLTLAWLLWPIWLSAGLRGERGERIVSVLVPANPVFAVNAVLRERLGYWAEQAIAYHYTSLSDDVSYGLPHSVWPCVALHGGIGLVCGLLSLRYGRRRGHDGVAVDLDVHEVNRGQR